MTPILYEEGETSYLSNGLGRLSDALSCIITQVAGGEYVLELKYPLEGIHADEITGNRIIYAKPEINKDPQPFIIREVDKTLKDQIKVTARHRAFDLSFYACGEFGSTESNGMTISQALSTIQANTAAIQTFPFALSAVPKTSGDTWATTTHEFKSEEPLSVRELLGSEEGRLINVFGGEIEYDDFMIKIHEQRGNDNGVSYRYGKNIKNISERINLDSLYTHAFSYWKGTSSSSTNTDDGDYYVVRGTTIQALDPGYSSMFPSQRTMIIDASSEFEEAPSSSDLDAYTNWYIESNKVGQPTVTITVDVVDLAMAEEYADISSLEMVNLYDVVTVIFPMFGINIKQRVSKVVFNVLREKNDSVTIGSTNVVLADIIANTQRNMVRSKRDLRSWADKCAERANRATCGWYGGNIKKNYDSGTHNQESMYIMNSDDEGSATKVIKAGGHGLGISTDGTEGEYSYMLDFTDPNGVKFSDEFAETGSTNASFLDRGAIDDGTSSWDIETGAIDMTGTFRGNFIGTIGGVDVGSQLSYLAGQIEYIKQYLGI